MSFRKRNPYMTINHGLIGAKKGQGDNRFILTWTHSEYSQANTKFFTFNSYEELMASGKYNWFSLLYTWISACDQISLIQDEGEVNPYKRLFLKDWNISFPETLVIDKQYDRDRGQWVVLKNHYSDSIGPKITVGSVAGNQPSIPLYDKESIQTALDNECKTPQMIMDMVNFDIQKWLETPKSPTNMKSLVIRTNQRGYSLWQLRYDDFNSTHANIRNQVIKDVEKATSESFKKPIYMNSVYYDEAYSNIQVCITNNELSLKTGTSYDDTYAYNFVIKKL